MKAENRERDGNGREWRKEGEEQGSGVCGNGVMK